MAKARSTAGGVMSEKIGSEKTREEWRGLVKALATDIERWSLEQGWLVSRQQKYLAEESLGRYAVPDLVIRLPEGRITFDVIGRDVVGAGGRVDISAFPSLNRMLLLRVGGKWKIMTDSRVPWPRAWGKASFIELAKLVASS